jgi:hypothetical protein|nr:MAG TPA: hypothetical protein [Caudoviricetes sp.]
MDKIPEEDKNVMNVTVINKPKKDGAFVDIFTMAITIVIFVAIIASYFVTVDTSAELNIQEITVEVVWLMAGTFSIGELIKKYARSRGRNTEAYKNAADEANEKIKTLCASPYRSRVSEYCENCTKSAIIAYRKHNLNLVGLTIEEYTDKYLGRGLTELLKEMTGKKISFAQYRAIRRCNKIKIKAYDPNFITSFNATFTSNKTPSEMFDAERADRINTIKSLILAFVSAVFIGRLFAKVIFNFSSAVIFAAIIKVIMILINVSFKASFGWNLSRMEIQRNKLRASETEACMEWCKQNPVQLVEKSDRLEPGFMLFGNKTEGYNK